MALIFKFYDRATKYFALCQGYVKNVSQLLSISIQEALAKHSSKRALSHPILWFLKSVEFHVVKCVCVWAWVREVGDAVNQWSSHGKMIVGTLTLPVNIMAIITAIFWYLLNCTCIPNNLKDSKQCSHTWWVSLQQHLHTDFFRFWTSERAILNRMSDKMCHSLWLYVLFSDLAIHTLCAVCTVQRTVNRNAFFFSLLRCKENTVCCTPDVNCFTCKTTWQVMRIFRPDVCMFTLATHIETCWSFSSTLSVWING